LTVIKAFPLLKIICEYAIIPFLLPFCTIEAYS
jgi:hypothetical protein